MMRRLLLNAVKERGGMVFSLPLVLRLVAHEEVPLGCKLAHEPDG